MGSSKDSTKIDKKPSVGKKRVPFFKKGHPKLGGRVKGTPNKITTDLKRAIINALNTLGGEAWLVDLAQDEKRAFASLLGKLIPMQLTGIGGGPIDLTVNDKTKLKKLSTAELIALRATIKKLDEGK